MLKLEIQQKGEEASVEEFEPGEIQIGRVNGNDIVLPKGNISKRHAKIVYANGSATLSDTNSTNGTFLNGERITSNPLSPADKIYLGEFVITVLGLDDDTGEESVEIPLDEATATGTELSDDVLEESSWGGQDDQNKEWNANWEAAGDAEEDDFDPLAAATDYSELEPSNDESPPDVIVPAAPNVVTRDFDPVETGAIDVDESIILDDVDFEEPDLDTPIAEEESTPEAPVEVAEVQQERPEPAPPPATSGTTLLAQHVFEDGTAVEEHSDGTTHNTTASLSELATSLELTLESDTAVSLGESYATWMSSGVIGRGRLIVQPREAFATSLDELQGQGVVAPNGAQLLKKVLKTGLSVAVLGNHGPTRRTVVSALAHEASQIGGISVVGLAGPTPEGSHLVNPNAGDEDLHLALRALSSDFTVVGPGLAEHQWEGVLALGLGGTITEAALGRSSHLETLFGALSIFDAVIVTGRLPNGGFGINAIESVEGTTGDLFTTSVYRGATDSLTLDDSVLAAKLQNA